VSESDRKQTIEVLASIVRHLNGLSSDVMEAIKLLRLMRIESEEYASKK
jgi:hypothetical protein